MRWLSLLLMLLGGLGLGGLMQYAIADVYANATIGRGLVVKPEYFGTHFHRLVLNPGEQAVRTSWPETAVNTIRLWDSEVRWADVAPKAGQWNFERMDAYVAQAAMHGNSVLYTLGSTPRWASARPDESCPYGFGCAAEPVRMAHWEEYVRRVAQRYRGRIGAYELWNEPFFSDIPQDRQAPSTFYSGSVAAMVEMARIARKVLDAEDPSAILLTPGFEGDTNRLDLFLSSGGKQYVQAVAFHLYTPNADEFVRRIAKVRQVMERNGVARLPLWNTETGVEVYPPETPLPPGANRVTRDQAAATLAQFLVLGAAAGLEHFYHYAWDNTRSGMIGPQGEIFPSMEVWSRVQNWLVGSRLAECRKDGGSVTICRGERESQRLVIVWADRSMDYSMQMTKGDRFVGAELSLGNAGRTVAAGDNRLHVHLGQAPLLLRFAPH